MKFSSTVIHAVAAICLIPSSAFADNMGFAGQVYKNEAEFNQFENMSLGDRVLVVTKNAWPECLSNKKLKNAEQCKKHIDAELNAMKLDVPIKSVIIYSRSPDSPTNNAIVIPIDDDNMVAGKHDDGKLYYDFEWCVKKLEVELDEDKIKQSRKLLQPSKWSKMINANKNVECKDVDGNGTLDAWHIKAKKEIGGNFEIACSTIDGMAKIAAAKAAGAIIKKGCNKIPVIDAKGCSGVDACKMIKDHMIPYPNKDGKNIECFLSYKKSSPKLRQIVQDLIENDKAPESVVKIYAMWNTKKVYEAPLMHGPQAEI